jgi:hypothetical protein
MNVRYEVARILLILLFPLDVARGVGFRAPADVSADVLIKETTEDGITIPIIHETSSSEFRLVVPRLFMDAFFVYGASVTIIDIKPSLERLSTEDALSLKCFLKAFKYDELVNVNLKTLIDMVNGSRNHVQFLSNLDLIYWYLQSTTVVEKQDFNSLMDSLKK